ncbi:MAG: hypothetical protein AMXMBFR7_47780 [Planctomycetota bacterium]
MAKLGKEQLVALHVMHRQGQPNTATAKLLGVSEGTVRYHVKRAAEGSIDGRQKDHLIERLDLEEVVRSWWSAQAESLGADRPPNVEALHAYLQAEHGYAHSYKSVLRYVRAAFPPPKLRPFRRIETPPGAQTQSDWVEATVDLGDADGPAKLYGFLMRLSHSRKKALVWSRRKDQLAWLHCHNEAYRRLGGVAAVNRVDNEKAAIARGAGPWGQINAVYRSYARTLKFHVDACEPRCPQQKGKVERGAGDVRNLGLGARRFESLEDLQRHTDRALEAEACRLACPATGQSVCASWEAERAYLTPLPAVLPEPFDLVKSARLHHDCTVRFEGRTYAAPFAYLDRRVEIRGCSGCVQIVDPASGTVLVTYPRHTPARLLVDARCYEGQATARVAAPKPLGRMSRKLFELAAQGVQRRSLELYAALAEVAR